MEFISATKDHGEYTYDPLTRTITWILGDVVVGDPSLWASVRFLAAGTYNLIPQLTTDTYDPTFSSNIQ